MNQNGTHPQPCYNSLRAVFMSQAGRQFTGLLSMQTWRPNRRARWGPQYPPAESTCVVEGQAWDLTLNRKAGS